MGALILASLLAAQAAPAALVRLDAGGAHTPVMPGWDALFPEGSTDPRVHIDRPGRPSERSDLDDLARDGVTGTQFTLDLPRGDYVVWVQQVPDTHTMFDFGPTNAGVMLAGRSYPHAWSQRVGEPGSQAIEAFLNSPAYAATLFPQFAPSESAWERVVAPRTAWSTATVTVGKDGLTIKPWGAPLTGLVVAPAQAEEQGAAWVAQADGQRRDQWLTQVHPEDAWWPAPQVGEGPIRLEVGDWTRLPDAARSTTEPVIRRTVARSSHVSVLLWVHPTASEVTVQLDGLDGLSLHEVHWLDMGEHPQPRRARPAFLRPITHTARGGQGVPVGIAITGEVPPRGPKRWRGRLTVTVDGHSQIVPITLDVAPTKLPPTALPVGFFLRWPAWLASLDTPAAPTTRRVVHDAFDLAAARGFRAMSIQDAPDTAPEGVPGPQRDLVTAWHARSDVAPFVWRYAGIRGDIYNRRKPAELSERSTGILTTLVRRPDDVVHFLFNEEMWRNHRALDQLITFDEAVRAIDPRARTAAACASSLCWDAAGSVDVLMMHDGTRVTRDMVDTLHHLGRTRDRPVQVWAYNTTAGRSAPWLAWAAGLDGLMRWQLNAAPADPSDDVLRPSTWGYTLLAPTGEVWPTVVLESLAQGVDDLRWISALQARDPDHPLLASLRLALDGGFGQDALDGEALDAATMDRMRQAVIDALPRR